MVSERLPIANAHGHSIVLLIYRAGLAQAMNF